jgi:hypothetical protein
MNRLDVSIRNSGNSTAYVGTHGRPEKSFVIIKPGDTLHFALDDNILRMKPSTKKEKK